MRVLRYDRQFTRRKFLADASRGFLATGVLMPLAKALANAGDIGGVYPDELMSIEEYTKGRIKTGDEISASNVEFGKLVIQVSEEGRLHLPLKRLEYAVGSGASHAARSKRRAGWETQ